MIPIGLVVIGIDALFLAGKMRASLPMDPHSLFIVNLLFGLPHILAGNIQLLDNEYLSYHRYGLIICALISFLFPYTVMTSFGLTVFIFVETLVAAFHAISQQVGITSLFSEFNRKFFTVWKWSAKVSVSIVAANIFVPPEYMTPTVQAALEPLLYLSLILNFLCGIHMFKSSSKLIGRVYIGANFFLILSFYLFSLWDYPFFSILVIRLPHDITAFLFYMNHSTVRNKEVNHNWVTKILKIPKSVGGYFLPLLVIPVAYFLEAWEAAFLFNAFMAYLHYTSEIFVWKSTGLSLKSIRLT
jgi:hypothetical protein